MRRIVEDSSMERRVPMEIIFDLFFRVHGKWSHGVSDNILYPGDGEL